MSSGSQKRRAEDPSQAGQEDAGGGASQEIGRATATAPVSTPAALSDVSKRGNRTADGGPEGGAVLPDGTALPGGDSSHDGPPSGNAHYSALGLDAAASSGTSAAAGEGLNFSDLSFSALAALWQDIRRFPLPVVFIVLFAAHQLGLDAKALQRLDLPQNLISLIGFEFIGSFLWTLSVAIWAEASGKTRWEQFLANTVGLLAIWLLLLGQGVFKTSPGLLMLTLVLVLSLAAHARNDEQNNAFWLYNQRLWFAAGRALMGSMVLVIGIFMFAGLIEFLFSKRLPDNFYSKSFLFSLGVIAPLVWLSMIPANDRPSNDWRLKAAAAAGAGSMLLQYVLVPLVIFYTLIIYRYAFTILQSGNVPSGRLGPTILAYVALGMTTFMMSYPNRNDGGPLVRLFWRGWFWIILVPALLLGLAVYLRIDAYGLSEARYLLALVVIWLLFLSAAYILFRVDDLRLIPASLAALLVLGTFGPPGATGMSVRSQSAQFAHVLARNNLLSADGQRLVGPVAKRLSENDETRLRSIIGFLDERNELQRLAPFFEGMADNPLRAGGGAIGFMQTLSAQQPQNSDRARRVAQLAAWLGLSQSPIGHEPSRTVVFYARAPAMIGLGGAKRIAGPVHISLSPGSNREILFVGVGTGRDLMVMLDESKLVIEDKRGRRAEFDLMAAARKIPWFENRRAVVPALTTPRRVAAKAGAGLNLRLLMTSLQGERSRSGGYAFKQISFWVLIGANSQSPPARQKPTR